MFAVSCCIRVEEHRVELHLRAARCYPLHMRRKEACKSDPWSFFLNGARPSYLCKFSLMSFLILASFVQ